MGLHRRPYRSGTRDGTVVALCVTFGMSSIAMVERCTDVSDRKKLLDLVQRADDRHLGKTVVRLAHLAVAAHQFEIAQESQRSDHVRVHGRDPRAVVPDRRDAATSVRTEVNR